MAQSNWLALKGQALSERELEIVRYVAQGMTNRDIGEKLFLSPATIKTHLARISMKIRAVNRAHIVGICASRGLVCQPTPKEESIWN